MVALLVLAGIAAAIAGGATFVTSHGHKSSKPAQTVLNVGDMIIAMGPAAAVERLDRMFQPPRGFSSIRGVIQEL